MPLPPTAWRFGWCATRASGAGRSAAFTVGLGGGGGGGPGGIGGGGQGDGYAGAAGNGYSGATGLADGADGVGETEGEAEALGLVVSNGTADSITAAGDWVA